MAGKDRGPVVDQRSLNGSFFRSPPIRRYLGGEGAAFLFCLWGQTPSSRIPVCNYTPQKTFIPLLFTGRDERET